MKTINNKLYFQNPQNYLDIWNHIHYEELNKIIFKCNYNRKYITK